MDSDRDSDFDVLHSDDGISSPRPHSVSEFACPAAKIGSSIGQLSPEDLYTGPKASCVSAVARPEENGGTSEATASAVQTLQEEVDNWKGQYEHGMRTINRINDTSHDQKMEIRSLKDKIEVLERERDAGRNLSVEYSREKQKVHEENRKLQADYHKANEISANLTMENQTLLEENETIKEKLDQAENNSIGLSAAVEELQKKVATLKKECEEAIKSGPAQEAAIQRLEDEVTTWRGQYDDAFKTLSSVVVESHDQKNEINVLKEKMNHLKEERDAAKNEVIAHSLAKQAAIDQSAMLRIENTKANDINVSQTIEKQSLIGRIEALTSECDVANKCAIAQEAEKQTLLEEINKLKEERDRAKSTAETFSRFETQLSTLDDLAFVVDHLKKNRNKPATQPASCNKCLKVHPENSPRRTLYDAVDSNDLKSVRAYLSLPCVANLLERGRGGCTPLKKAVEKGYAEITAELLHAGANSSFIDKRAIETIIANNNASLLRALWDHGLKIVEEYILQAAKNGKADVIRLLIELGVDCMIAHKENDAPIHLASKNNHVEVVRLLLEQGVDVNMRGQNEYTPLLYAAEKGAVDIVRLLLEMGADCTLTKKVYDTVIHKASERNHVEVVRLLLEHGVDANMKGWYDWRPLHYAASKGHADVVRLLLEKGADPTIKITLGRSALDLAKENKHQDIVDILSMHLS